MLATDVRGQIKTLGLQRLDNVTKSAFSTPEAPTAYAHVVSYMPGLRRGGLSWPYTEGRRPST